MKPATSKSYEQRILRVLMHIQRNLDTAPGLDELAAVASFSSFHFHRVFRGMVGESVGEHVRRLRLERAAYRLRYARASVTDIAFEAGYEAAEAFTRAFKDMFGRAPSVYRRDTNGRAVPEAPSGVHFAEGGRVTDFVPLRDGRPVSVALKTLPSCRVAFARHTGPYAGVGGTWEALCAWAGERRLFGADTRFLGICYDNPDVTPAGRIRYDACLTVSGPTEPEGRFGVQEIAGGTFAEVVHKGPYEAMKEVYDWLAGSWLPASGYEAADRPFLEIYRNTPDDVPDEQLITELLLPVVRWSRSGPVATPQRPIPIFHPLEPHRGEPAMEVAIKEIAAKRVLALAHVGPYTGIGAAFEKLCAFAGEKGLLGPATEVLAIYYDDPAQTPAEALRSEACVTVAGPVEVPEGFQVKEIAGGPYAVTVHEGPYEALAGVYTRLYREWPETSGRQPNYGQPCFEVYLNSPDEVKPEELKTEIHMPLAG